MKQPTAREWLERLTEVDEMRREARAKGNYSAAERLTSQWRSMCKDIARHAAARRSKRARNPVDRLAVARDQAEYEGSWGAVAALAKEIRELEKQLAAERAEADRKAMALADLDGLAADIVAMIAELPADQREVIRAALNGETGHVVEANAH